ncbi:MAG: hypothetical protein A2Y10_07835 [Planctomycetes bacterium GWF2_41_51]|nr:MAG: hypothetical protein A2Y10_07835 [Planctomycetes bacterium GWF2_41_51]HBG26825.1 hypothetical protein [Phycisphaerales bacterium]
MTGLKKLCVLTTIVLLLFSALTCITGSIMGVQWSKWFFNTLPGESLGLSIGLLFAAELLGFGNIRFITSAIRNWFRWSKAEILIAIVLLIVIGFIYFTRISSVQSHQLKSVFFVPHIFTCLLSYVFFALAAFFSGKCLIDKKQESENNSYRFVCLGFPFLTAGIVLGSMWAMSAWGDWWSWDPKESFSLAVWLVFAAFLHLRILYGQRFLRLNCFWVIIGFLLIILGVTLVNFSRIFAGLHNYSG